MQKKIGLATLLFCAFTSLSNADTAPTEHGEYINWRVLGVSHRLDKKYVRSILGNDTAINAARSGKTGPWPEGTVIAKLSWKEQIHPNWPNAIVPGEFAGAEAMVKDSKKYPETGGWGFGRWEGKNLVMHDKDKANVCFACHMPMQASDYVYTVPHLR